MNGKFLNYSQHRIKFLKTLRYKLYMINVSCFPTNENEFDKLPKSNSKLIYMNCTCHFR